MLYELITIRREFRKVKRIDLEQVYQSDIDRLIDSIPSFKAEGGKEFYSKNRLYSISPDNQSSVERQWRIVKTATETHDPTLYIKELEPDWNDVDSYEGEALILHKGKARSVLTSFGKIVAERDLFGFRIIGNHGNKTMRHIKEFLFQEGFCLGEKKANGIIRKQQRN